MLVKYSKMHHRTKILFDSNRDCLVCFDSRCRFRNHNSKLLNNINDMICETIKFYERYNKQIFTNIHSHIIEISVFETKFYIFKNK